MDDILDAQEAIERELFQLEDGDSSSEENETEVEKLLYSVSHYAPDLSSENSLAFDKVDSKRDSETSPCLVSTENEGQISLPEQLPKRKRKSISKRYYEMLDKEADIQVCKTCKKQGHTKEKCMEWKKEIVCYNCNEMGHFSRECRKKKDEVCFNCNETGHKYRLCPNTSKDIVCFNCNEKGHFAATCTEYKNKTNLECSNAKPKYNNEYIEERKSHSSKTDPLRNKAEMINLKCHCCEKRGHFARECPDAIDIVENQTEKKQSVSKGLPLYESKWSFSPLGSCNTPSNLEMNLNLEEKKKGSQIKFGIYHSPICRNANEICEISETKDDSMVDNLSESLGGEQLGKNTAADFMMIKSTDNDKNNSEHGKESSEVLKKKKKKKKSAKKRKNQDCNDVTFSGEGIFESKKDHDFKQSSNDNDREVLLGKKKNNAKNNSCMAGLSLSNGSPEYPILVESEKQDEFQGQLDVVNLRSNNKRKKKLSNVSKENHDITLSKEKQSFPNYSPLMDLGVNEQVAKKKCKTKNVMDKSSCLNAEKSTDKASMQKILDQETLRNLSKILLESSGDESDYCDPGGRADHLMSPDINLDAESVSDVISIASDCSIEECFSDTKGNRDATYYDPTNLCEEHLQVYGLNESATHLENENQASSLRKRKPNPETSPTKKRKMASHKRKGNILESFKKNFSCGTRRSVRTGPTCYGSKTKRNREERGFVFKFRYSYIHFLALKVHKEALNIFD